MSVKSSQVKSVIMSCHHPLYILARIVHLSIHHRPASPPPLDPLLIYLRPDVNEPKDGRLERRDEQDGQRRGRVEPDGGVLVFFFGYLMPCVVLCYLSFGMPCALFRSVLIHWQWGGGGRWHVCVDMCARVPYTDHSLLSSPLTRPLLNTRHPPTYQWCITCCSQFNCAVMESVAA